MNKPSLGVFSAVFSMGVVLLLLQIVVSRILSATVGYHAAFGVIALVMLGLASAGTTVFLHRNRDKPAPISHAIWALLGAGGAACIAIFAYTWLGAAGFEAQKSINIVASGILFFPPFFLVGYALAYLLTEYAEDVARVYWIDLTGAAAGCIISVPLLDLLSAPQIVVLCGAICVAGGLALARALGGIQTKMWALAGVVFLTLVVVVAVPESVRLRFAKGMLQDDLLYEEWNHISRINVFPNAPGVLDAVDALGRERFPDLTREEIAYRWAAGWGVSRKFKGYIPESYYLQIDSGAGTPILKQGPQTLDKLDILAWDATASAHQMKAGHLGRTYVIGGGGGRDILTALYFGAERVDVAELNPGVHRAANEALGDYSGRPYSADRVHAHVGEARYWLSQSGAKFDLIQISMIDTFAASSAGAMVFTENVLYTTEAVGLFLDSLDEDGMLTVSRFYHREQFGEIARVLVIAREVLISRGIENPEDHIAMVYAEAPYGGFLGTVVMKRSPFSTEDLDRTQKNALEKGFFTLWPKLPDVSSDEDNLDVGALLRGEPVPGTEEFNLDPATDDKPFFFNLHKPLQSWIKAIQTGEWGTGSRSTQILGLLTLIILFASRSFVLKPLQTYNESRPEAERGPAFGGPMMVYFAGIGVGFMCVELALIQRYIVFLGNPTDALSVVLFALLLFGGLGSSLSAKLPQAATGRALLGLVLVGILLTAVGVPPLVQSVAAWSHTARVIVAVALIAPLSVAMGTVYPIGVRLLMESDNEALVPWAWAVNGVAGVLATTVGMFVAMNYGYTALLMVGALGYIATLAAAFRARPGSWE